LEVPYRDGIYGFSDLGWKVFCTELSKNRDELFKMVSDGFRWVQMVSGGFRWFQVVSGGFRWFQVVSDGFRWVQVVSQCSYG
jgi:hypothetical protein